MYKHVYEEPMVEGAPLPFKLPQWIACAPFEEFLGMHIAEAHDGRAVLTMPYKVKLAQGWGLMHGGAVTALADTAVAIAIKTLLPEGSKFATTDLSLQFHAPVKGGTVTAVAQVIEQDERQLTGEAVVSDAHGKKIATFRSVFRVKR